MSPTDGNTVHRLHSEPVAAPAPRREKAPDAAPAPNRSYETAIAVIQAGAYALSARALLLLALIGAFVLAWQAMAQQTVFSLGVLTIYGSFTILPAAYLEARRGRTP